MFGAILTILTLNYGEKSVNEVSPLKRQTSIIRHLCWQQPCPFLLQPCYFAGHSHFPVCLSSGWNEENKDDHLIKSLPEGGWEESHCGFRSLRPLRWKHLATVKGSLWGLYLPSHTPAFYSGLTLLLFKPPTCACSRPACIATQPSSRIFNQFYYKCSEGEKWRDPMH